jgi:hypothetical protein
MLRRAVVWVMVIPMLPFAVAGTVARLVFEYLKIGWKLLDD